MAYKRPRAKCPYCGRTKMVKSDGTMRKHARRSSDPALDGKPCAGSGQRSS